MQQVREQPAWVSASGAVAAGMATAFLVLVVALQWLRGDLDWVAEQLSAYLHGRYGLVLRSAYCALAVAMAAMAWGLRGALRPPARSVGVLVLFHGAALGLCGVAVGDSWLPELAPAWALQVHVASASIAFACAVIAVWWQSLLFARDARWAARGRWAWPLALLATLALAWHLGIGGTTKGVSQKLAIVLIVVWLGRVGACIAVDGRRGAALVGARRDNGRIQPEED